MRERTRAGSARHAGQLPGGRWTRTAEVREVIRKLDVRVFELGKVRAVHAAELPSALRSPDEEPIADEEPDGQSTRLARAAGLM